MAPPVRNGAVTTGQLNNVGTQLDLSRSISSNNNRLLVVGISAENGATGPVIGSVTFDPGGGNEASLTQIDTINNASRTYAEIWALVAPATGGPYTIRVATSGGNMAIFALAADYYDAKQSLPTLKNSTSASSVTSIQITINSVPADCATLDVATNSANRAPMTADDSRTVLWTVANTGFPEDFTTGQCEKFPGSGNITLASTFSASGTRVVQCGIAVEPVAAATTYTQTAFRLYNDDGTGLGPPP